MTNAGRKGGLIRSALGLPQRPGCEGMDGGALPAGRQWVSSAPEPGPAAAAGADRSCSRAAGGSCALTDHVSSASVVMSGRYSIFELPTLSIATYPVLFDSIMAITTVR